MAERGRLRWEADELPELELRVESERTGDAAIKSSASRRIPSPSSSSSDPRRNSEPEDAFLCNTGRGGIAMDEDWVG